VMLWSVMLLWLCCCSSFVVDVSIFRRNGRCSELTLSVRLKVLFSALKMRGELCESQTDDGRSSTGTTTIDSYPPSS
jgi:hypothetical protein